MPDNPTLTPAARRMLTALGGAAYANDLAKSYADTLKNHPNNKWAPSEIARYNAAAEAAQEPLATDRHMVAPFDITEADIGRYVREKSTGKVDQVRRDPGNGWLHPGLTYEWRQSRDELEYVKVQPLPAWVPVAEVPEAWKDGRWVLALHDEFNSTWSVQWVTDKPVNRSGRYDWRDESGWNGEITHICDCIPRSGP